MEVQPRQMAVAQAETWQPYDDAEWWTSSDRDMQVRTAHNVEICEPDGDSSTTHHTHVADVNWIEDVNAAGEKRTAEEAGMDASQQSSETVGRGNVRVLRPLRKDPPAGLPRTMGTAQAKRVRRQIQGMSTLTPFDAAQALRNTTVTLSWMELANIAPQIRVQLGQAMRLTKDPDKPTKPRAAPKRTDL